MKKDYTKEIMNSCKFVLFVMFVIILCAKFDLLVVLKYVKEEVETLGLFVAIMGLIITIWLDRLESKKTIKINVQTQYQLNFEKILNHELQIYVDVVNDLTSFDFKKGNTKYDYISEESIIFLEKLPVKYSFELMRMNNNILYSYKELDKQHLKLDELINNINCLNNYICLELKKIFDLVKFARSINELYSTITYDDFEQINHDLNKLYKDYGNISLSIIQEIDYKTSSIYKLSLDVIEERSKIIMNN